MEYVQGGSLMSLLDDKAMPEFKVKYIIKQLVRALNYLHSTMEIAHRDLKPDNVLIERPNHDGQEGEQQ